MERRVTAEDIANRASVSSNINAFIVGSWTSTGMDILVLKLLPGLGRTDSSVLTAKASSTGGSAEIVPLNDLLRLSITNSPMPTYWSGTALGMFVRERQINMKAGADYGFHIPTKCN